MSPTKTVPAAAIIALAAPILAACAGPSIDVSECDVALTVTMETLEASLTERGRCATVAPMSGLTTSSS